MDARFRVERSVQVLNSLVVLVGFLYMLLTIITVEPMGLDRLGNEPIA